MMCCRNYVIVQETDTSNMVLLLVVATAAIMCSVCYCMLACLMHPIC